MPCGVAFLGRTIVAELYGSCLLGTGLLGRCATGAIGADGATDLERRGHERGLATVGDGWNGSRLRMGCSGRDTFAVVLGGGFIEARGIAFCGKG